MLIGEAIWEQNGFAAERVAVVDDELSLTYAELAYAVSGFAETLRDRGVRAGHRVICQLPNGCGLLIALLSCVRLGAVPVMLLMAHRKREVLQAIDTLNPAAAITVQAHRGHPHLAELEMLVAQGGKRIPVIAYDPRMVHGVRTFEGDSDHISGAAIGGSAESDAVSDNDDVLILMSGGTTSRPKFVPHTHRGYYHAISACAAVSRLSAETVYLAALPAAHNFTLASPGVLGVLIAGGTVVFSQTPNPDRAVPLIGRHGVTTTAIVPSVAQRWLEYAATGQAKLLDSLDVIQIGGADTAPALVQGLGYVFGAKVQRVYGMSEGFVAMTRLSDPAEVIENSVGIPVSERDAIRVVSVSSSDEISGTGELLTRGESTVRGYLVAGGHIDRSAFDDEGWYHTGDLVRTRPDGRLELRGRISDVVNRGGEKISLAEVEALLGEIPGVRAAAAVGIPHPQLGECVGVALVCDTGVQIGVHDVQNHFRETGTSHMKLPEVICLLDAIPQTAMGKTDRAQLRSKLTVRRTDDLSFPSIRGTARQQYSPVRKV